jgi:transcriptional regulator with XRE-family HTH domain
MSVNERVREYILENGLKFSFVAERAKVDIKKFSRWMSNRQPMTTDEYETVCVDGLKVTPDFFYSRKFLETKNNSTA